MGQPINHSVNQSANQSLSYVSCIQYNTFMYVQYVWIRFIQAWFNCRWRQWSIPRWTLLWGGGVVWLVERVGGACGNLLLCRSICQPDVFTWLQKWSPEKGGKLAEKGVDTRLFVHNAIISGFQRPTKQSGYGKVHYGCTKRLNGKI